MFTGINFAGTILAEITVIKVIKVNNFVKF